MRPHLTPLRATPVLALLLLALGAGSCARQLPTAPQVSRDPGTPYTLDNPTQEVCVTVAPGTDGTALAADYHATVSDPQWYQCINLLPPAGETPDQLAATMAGDSRVVTAERNGTLETAEARQQSFGFDDGNGSPQTAADQPALTATGMREAQAISQGEGIRVAILDTGIDPTHPLFAGRIVGGWDCVDGDSDPTDVKDGVDNDHDGFVDEAYGHGTHVAGIVALTAPRARLLILRVLDADGIGDMRTVATGIRWARTHGARVINLSLGSLTVSKAVETALAEAEAAGVICVVSAGNWGAEQPEEFPASSGHAMAIAAVNAQEHAAPFTSYGSFVALSAPGVLVRSAYPGDRWMLWSGTSMAAPFVSGTAALLLALHPDWRAADLRARLAATALPVTADDPSIVSKLGAGGLDAGAALLPDSPGGGAGGGEDPLKRSTF